MKRHHVLLASMLCLAVLDLATPFGSTPVQAAFDDPKPPPKPTAPVTTTSPNANNVLTTNADGTVATITGTVTTWPFGHRPTYVAVTIVFENGSIAVVDFPCSATNPCTFTGTINLGITQIGPGTISFQPVEGGMPDDLGNWIGGDKIGTETEKPVNVQKPPTPGGGGGS